MTAPGDVAGTAALAICQSLLLAPKDCKVLPEGEIVGIVDAAAAAYMTTPSGADVARGTPPWPRSSTAFFRAARPLRRR